MLSVGISEAKLGLAPYWLLSEAQQAFALDTSQLLWLYLNRNTINNIPVDDTAKNLNVDNFLQVSKALLLQGTLKVWTGYLSPQDLDKKALEQYQKIKDLEGSRQVQVVSLLRQFCPSLNKFLILLTYYLMKYTLNPRYLFLRNNNESTIVNV